MSLPVLGLDRAFTSTETACQVYLNNNNGYFSLQRSENSEFRTELAMHKALCDEYRAAKVDADAYR